MTVEISLWSAVTLAALLLPNLLYVFFKPVNPETAEPPKPFLGWLEQLGRMGCILLMCVNIGPFQFGFRSDAVFAIWLIAMAGCIAGYWGMWVWYFVNGRRFALWSRMPMAILPSAAFLLTGALCLNAALCSLRRCSRLHIVTTHTARCVSCAKRSAAARQKGRKKLDIWMQSCIITKV